MKFDLTRRPFLLFTVLILTMFILNGCNIFGWSAKDDNFDGYMDNGREYMHEGDYSAALEQFEKALEINPNSSDAHYYHAKATVAVAGIDIGVILDELEAASEQDNLPLYSRDTTKTEAEDIAYKNKIYQANTVVVNDLQAIYQGQSTGRFSADDVDVDLAVATAIVGIVGLRDTDRDGDIDENDIYMDIVTQSDGTFLFRDVSQFFDYSPGAGENPAGYDSTGAEYFNGLLQWTANTLINSRELINNILQRIDPELNLDEVNELIDNIVETINKYYINTGTPSNPGIGDNDNDGYTDEEHWGDITNGDRDGDGYYWEDSTIDY